MLPKSSKRLNGIFRSWMSVDQIDGSAPPIIWGKCIVHLSNPEFSGRILHTSGVLEIVEHGSFEIAETRNSYYALLGPKVALPIGSAYSPEAYLAEDQRQSLVTDAYVSAAMTADQDCPACRGAGVYSRGGGGLAVCDICCKHVQGWWLLEGAYGADNGRWACKAGCGTIVDTAPPPELEFLPRAVNGRAR